MSIEMGRKSPDITGETFGELKVLGRAVHHSGRPGWLCECTCGSLIILRYSVLVSGNTKSCGCFKAQKMRTQMTTHGMCKDDLYYTWENMKNRCYNQGSESYKDYGGRGISICDSWRYSFPAFLRDVGERPDGTTIDRIDNNGNYEPGNVKWSTRLEQNNNRRNRTHCFSGHEYPSDLPFVPNGTGTTTRRCIICMEEKKNGQES